MAKFTLSLRERLLLSKEYTTWAHDKRIPISPSSFLAYLEIQELLNADAVREHLTKSKEKIENE